MAGRNDDDVQAGVEEDSRFAALLDEALGPEDPPCAAPIDLADRIVSVTRQRLPRPGVVGTIGPRTGALRWVASLAASVLLAVSAAIWIAGYPDEAMTDEDLARALVQLEADIDSMLTDSTWDASYSALAEELAGWELHVGTATRMDQF